METTLQSTTKECISPGSRISSNYTQAATKNMILSLKSTGATNKPTPSSQCLKICINIHVVALISMINHHWDELCALTGQDCEKLRAKQDVRYCKKAIKPGTIYTTHGFGIDRVHANRLVSWLEDRESCREEPDPARDLRSAECFTHAKTKCTLSNARKKNTPVGGSNTRSS